MQNLLPVVKPEVGNCIEHELLRVKNDKLYIENQLEEINKENPVISYWIKNFSKKTKDEEGAVFCGLMVFKLLKIQAECDQMKLDIRI